MKVRLESRLTRYFPILVFMTLGLSAFSTLSQFAYAEADHSVEVRCTQTEFPPQEDSITEEDSTTMGSVEVAGDLTYGIIPEMSQSAFVSGKLTININVTVSNENDSIPFNLNKEIPVSGVYATPSELSTSSGKHTEILSLISSASLDDAQSAALEYFNIGQWNDTKTGELSISTLGGFANFNFDQLKCTVNVGSKL